MSLGKSGPQISFVGLGCNNFGGRLDPDASRQVIERALERGINLFDTADSYGNRGGSEEILGSVLAHRRRDIVLATKFGWQMDAEGNPRGAAQACISTAVEASLRRLRTERSGTTGEVAAVVCFLSSAEAGYVTGQTLHVNSGVYFC